MKIYLVDDETIFSTTIKKRLFELGYNLEVFSSFRELTNYEGGVQCDLFIIDISLPDKDGFGIISYIRNSLSLDIPIIVLSGYHFIEYKVQALNLGADDYMTKPFSPDELIARIKVLVRRKRPLLFPTQLKYKDISLDLNSREVRKSGEVIALTKKEKQVLEFFLFNVGRLVTQTELINSVRDKLKSSEKIKNTLGVTIFNIRKKLGEDFQLETHIKEGFFLKS